MVILNARVEPKLTYLVAMSEPIASTSTEHFWSPAYDAASLELGSIRSSLSDLPTPLLRISKVSQLDSTLLDRELNLILQEPLVKALELLRVSLASFMSRVS